MNFSRLVPVHKGFGDGGTIISSAERIHQKTRLDRLQPQSQYRRPRTGRQTNDTNVKTFG